MLSGAMIPTFGKVQGLDHADLDWNKKCTQKTVSRSVPSGRVGQASDGRNQISVVRFVVVDSMLSNPA